MDRKELYKRVAISFFLFCSALLLVRVTHGAFLFLMSLMGVIWAAKDQVGKAWSVYAMILFMIVVNPYFLPKNGILYGFGLRFSPFLISIVLAMRGLASRNRIRMPFGVLLIYLMVAGISSAQGWAPLVSYMKMANFIAFLLGVWFGSLRLIDDFSEMKILRSTLIAMCVFLIMGSVALLPFPGVSTMIGLGQRDLGESLDMLNVMANEQILKGQMSLFVGVTFHSQALAPLLSCAFAYILCDLLFVEERFSFWHCVLLICSIPLLYKTRSRVAFVSLVTIAAMVYLYLPRKVYMNRNVRKWLMGTLCLFGVVLTSVVVIAEVESDAISKWVRKTNDVEGDQRSLQEAFTSSRQGLIELSLLDFRRNPLLGSGFQVSYSTQEYVRRTKGFILSAPIEKGLLPLMVLGETGVVGSIVFSLFVISFWIGCSSKKLYVTLSMMVLMWAINMGEAVFFSPGGSGGTEWVFCIVGGYLVDMWIIRVNHIRFQNGLNLIS